MRGLIIIVLLSASSLAFAQNNMQEQLYYHSPKGLSFIPPLSRPGLVYNGKLYIGKKKLSVLFQTLHDEQLNFYFKKYKDNKTSADILSFVGGFGLPIANIFISTNQGKVNWWLIGSSVILNATSGVLKVQAEKNLLLAAAYYDKKMGYASNFVPQQQNIGFTIPLGK